MSNLGPFLDLPAAAAECRRHNVEPPERGFVADGKWHRLHHQKSVDSKRNGDASYRLYRTSSGKFFLVLYTFKGGGETLYSGPLDAEVSEHAWEEFGDWLRASEDASRRKHQEAAQEARWRWQRAAPASDDHPYLRRKGVPASGIRQEGQHLLIPVTDLDGNFQSVQTIAGDGSRLFLRGGQIGGGSFRIAGTDTIAVVEGYATGMSVHLATGWTVHVAFNAGNMPKVADALLSRFPDATVYACGDNDESQTGQSYARRAERMGAAYAVPPEAGDWNDMEAKYGRDWVRERLVAIEAKLEVDLVTGERRLKVALSEFILGGGMNVGVIKAETGLGKTTMTLKSLMQAFRQQAVRRATIAVPNHELAEELRDRWNDAYTSVTGIEAKIFQGRGREGMCGNPDGRKRIQSSGYPLSQFCWSVCPMREGCPYLTQTAEKQRLWIVTHSQLKTATPKGMGHIDLLIIDESYDALVEHSMPMELFEMRESQVAKLPTCPFSDLHLHPEQWGRRNRVAEKWLKHWATASLSDEERYGLDLIRNPREAVQRQALATGLRPREPSIIPTPICRVGLERMLFKANEDGVERAAKSLWRTGICEIHGTVGDNDRTWRLLKTRDEAVLRYPRRPHPSWGSKTLLLDATAEMDLIRVVWPTAVLEADIRIEKPHQEAVRVTVGGEQKAFAKRMFIPEELKPGSGRKQTEARNRTRGKNLLRLKRRILKAEGPVGLITHLDVEIMLVGDRADATRKARQAELYKLLPADVVKKLRTGWPPDTDLHLVTGHFNGVRGSNAFENVRSLFVVGRPFPPSTELERLAGVIFDRPSPTQGQKELVLTSIRDAEIINGSIGRARGCRRTADNPVTVYLMNDVPYPADRTEEWGDTTKTSPPRMLRQEGLVILDFSQRGALPVVAAMLPDLFPSPKTVNKSRDQGRHDWDPVVSPAGWLRCRVKAPCARYAIDAIVDPDRLEAIAARMQVIPAAKVD